MAKHNTSISDFAEAETPVERQARADRWLWEKLWTLIEAARRNEQFARDMTAWVAASFPQFLPQPRKGRPTKWDRVRRIILLEEFEALSTRMKKGQAERFLADKNGKHGADGPRDIRKYLTVARKERAKNQ